MHSGSLVEGLGDEVLIFLTTVVLAGLILVAWWSTAVRDRPRVEAVLLQPLRGSHSRGELIYADGGRRPIDVDPGEEAAGVVDVEDEVNEDPQTEQEEVEEETTETVDGDDEDTSPPHSSSSTSEAGTKESNKSETATEESNQSTEAPSSPSAVTIKIKFLNDSEKVVRTTLDEKLGRFKRRNFATETADNQTTVRLIFNGHVLNGEEPLSHYGLFDNCVVHCLISRSQPQQQQQTASDSGHHDHIRHHHLLDEDSLDLSHMCYPLLGSVLVILWWCQIVYSHYFSLASSISLVSLTVLFLASIANTYIY